MPSWIAVLKIYYDAANYAQASVIAEVCRGHAEVELEPAAGDAAAVADVIPRGYDDTRMERVVTLRRARNVLIALGHQRAVDIAREVDMIADIISNPAADLDAHPPYDYGKFMTAVAAVQKGGNPDV